MPANHDHTRLRLAAEPRINIRQHGRGPYSVTAGCRACWCNECDGCEAERRAKADKDGAMSMGLGINEEGKA